MWVNTQHKHVHLSRGTFIWLTICLKSVMYRYYMVIWGNASQCKKGLSISISVWSQILVFTVDGGWTSWLPWSACSLTCGVGVTSRIRSCSAPSPEWGGAYCIGRGSETLSCHLNNCSGWIQIQYFMRSTLLYPENNVYKRVQKVWMFITHFSCSLIQALKSYHLFNIAIIVPPISRSKSRSISCAIRIKLDTCKLHRV